MTDKLAPVCVGRRDMPQIAAVLEKAWTAASLAGVPFSPRCCVYRPVATTWLRGGDAPTAVHHAPGPFEHRTLRHPAVPYDLEWLFGEMALCESRRTPVPPTDR
ncbi:MAG: hypothetical protein PVG54_15270 [Anaerolineae bacterium]|jgi:hypothetical protein